MSMVIWAGFGARLGTEATSVMKSRSSSFSFDERRPMSSATMLSTLMLVTLPMRTVYGPIVSWR